MMKVLVVEDEEMIRKGMIESIDWAALDCKVVAEACNGRMALDLVEKHDPSLIITDIRMPGMDGIEFLRKLRGQGNQAFVIILTAYDNFEYIRSALRLGAVDYLLKPLCDGELEQIIMKLQHRPMPLKEASLICSKRKKEDMSLYVLEAIAYIDENYGNPTVSVSTVAEFLGISESHLSHLFKKETNYTLLNYLTRYRIQKAAELLKNYRLKVYEVAGRVGYRDVSYFAAVFKKLVGISPSDYQDTNI